MRAVRCQKDRKKPSKPSIYHSLRKNGHSKLTQTQLKLNSTPNSVISLSLALKTHSFWVFQHVFCLFVNALMNLNAFEFGNVLLVKSMETVFSVAYCIYSIKRRT